MTEIGDVKVLIDRAFMFVPDALISVLKNKRPIAVLCKEDWEGDRYSHIKEECKQHKPPAFVEMGEIPGIGKVININIDEEV
jgi:hypothetical protein